MPKIEEVVDDSDVDDGSSDDMPELEQAGQGEGSPDQKGKKANRSEKKSRKAVEKLGMKPVIDINRVCVRKSKNILFVIAKPDVFKASNDTYVVFGEATCEDLSAQAQANAAQQFAQSEMPVQTKQKTVTDEGDADETGVAENDIALVIDQVGCTRAVAVKALKKNNLDIVETIMELSG